MGDGMREMTREQVETWVRSEAAQYGGRLSVYARRRQVPLTTLMNALKRRHAWTPYTLCAVGLEGVQVVADVKAVKVPAKPVRRYRPMWQLGDWPSRYRVTE